MKELVKTHSLGEKDKLIFITGEFIQYEKKVLNLNEITGIHSWISGIQFYRFLIGRKYHIGLKTPTDQINFLFTCYFGISQKYFNKLYNQVLGKIWEPVTTRIWNLNYELVKAGGAMQVGNCQLSKDGILLIRQKKQINWDDFYYEIKYDRVVLNSKTDSTLWMNLYFKDTWNLDVFISLLDWITKENGLSELKQ